MRLVIQGGRRFGRRARARKTQELQRQVDALVAEWVAAGFTKEQAVALLQEALFGNQPPLRFFGP